MLPIYPDSQRRWLRCQDCRLYESRRNVVLYRTGTIRNGLAANNDPTLPLFLFIGEAPGQQEDHSGLPFQGRSGYILNQYFKYSKASFNYCITNLVGCRPTEIGFRDQVINREPTQPEQDACKPRLDDLCKLFDFDGIVYLGKLAANYRTNLRRTLELPHPAFILRMEFKLYSIKRAAQQLEKYVISWTQSRTTSISR